MQEDNYKLQAGKTNPPGFLIGAGSLLTAAFVSDARSFICGESSVVPAFDLNQFFYEFD